MLTFLPGFSFRKIGWLHSGQLAALASIAAWQFGHCLFPRPGLTSACGASVASGVFPTAVVCVTSSSPSENWNCCRSGGLLLSWHWCFILDWVWIMATRGNSQRQSRLATSRRDFVELRWTGPATPTWWQFGCRRKTGEVVAGKGTVVAWASGIQSSAARFRQAQASTPSSRRLPAAGSSAPARQPGDTRRIKGLAVVR